MRQCVANIHAVRVHLIGPEQIVNSIPVLPFLFQKDTNVFRNLRIFRGIGFDRLQNGDRGIEVFCRKTIKREEFFRIYRGFLFRNQRVDAIGLKLKLPSDNRLACMPRVPGL